MYQPLVSVNMITYNHAPFIAQAINGVLAQKTDFEIELLIGEDCSTDGTREIVLRLAEQHPGMLRVITSQNNVGPRQNGLRVFQESRGKYIAYCEGDDFWHDRDKLQMQVSYLENKPDYGLVYSDYDRYEVEKRVLHKNCVHALNGGRSQAAGTISILRGRSGIQTCTVVTEKQLVEDIYDSDPYLYKTGPFMMGDTQLWTEISILRKIHYIDRSLATHQVLPESATQSKNLSKKLRFRKSGAELCIYLAKKHDLPGWLIDHHQNLLWDIRLKLAFLENEPTLAKQIHKSMRSSSAKQNALYLCTICRPFGILFKPLFLQYARRHW